MTGGNRLALPGLPRGIPARMLAGMALLDERFLLLEALGRGAEAAVLRAFDRIGEREVALKLLHRRVAAAARHPAAGEFEACSRVAHPAVVRMFELGVTRSGPLPRGRPYLVMEHVPGVPVHEALAPGRVDGESLERVAVETLRALAAVHAQGLVHRDVKPHNLLVVRRGERVAGVKLTDFGLAAPRGRVDPPGRLSGSWRYLAPEGILGAPLDGRADLYALGLTLAFLATGVRPCPYGGAAALRWHLTAEPVRLPRAVAPARLRRLVRSMTERPPARRPLGAAAALAVLGLEREPVRELETTRSARLRLRLDLDAARLGGRRLHRLPRGIRAEERVIREALVWAEVRGAAFADLRRGVAGLRGLLLRGDRGHDDWRALGERVGVYWCNGAALTLPGSVAGGAETIVEVLRLLRPRPLVAVDDGGELGAALAREAARHPGGGPGAGGFVLLTHRRS